MLKREKIEKVNRIEVLIISDTMDFTTDYICIELKDRNSNYLRINRDLFQKYNIKFDIGNEVLYITISGKEYIVDSAYLKSIYYRAPIYLHSTYNSNLSFEKQLYRSQWTAFLRNLVLFEDVIWMNNPVNTFKAENKMLQLKYAKQVGFKYPHTLLLNSLENVKINESSNYILKSLDTVLLKKDQKEAFVYTNVIEGRELIESEFTIAPVVLQKYLHPKVDLRVTVIGSRVFAVKIVKDDKGVAGDWRKVKEHLDFLVTNLPEDIKKKCVKIVKKFGLVFGGIDLIFHNNSYYFIEVNPTGEWGWLKNKSNMKIDKAICDYLLGIQ